MLTGRRHNSLSFCMPLIQAAEYFHPHPTAAPINCGDQCRCMNEEEIIRLSEHDVAKIERVNDSFSRREEAEAAKESQQKLRILFERTAQEALPFVIYVIYMGGMALVVVFKLLDYEGTKLWLGAGLLGFVMLAPLLVLPRASFWWLKRRSAKMIGAECKPPANSDAMASPEAD